MVGASLVVAVGLGLLSGRMLFGPGVPTMHAPKRPSSAAAPAHAPPVEQELALPEMVEVEEPLPASRLDALEREARIAFVRGDGRTSAAIYRRVLEPSPGAGAIGRYLSLMPDASDRQRIARELRALPTEP